MSSHRFVSHSVCEQDYCKSNQLISFRLGVMVRPTNWEKLLNFGTDSVPDTDSRSLFHFPHHCGKGYFRRFISISHWLTFMTLGKMTDADNVIDQ